MTWEIRKRATDVAYRAVSSLEGAGIFAVELFLTGDGQVVSPLLFLRLLNYLLLLDATLTFFFSFNLLLQQFSAFD